VLTPKLMRDLGNMTFAFVILWAYTSISQYLIIWSANLPEEIVYYVKRNQGGWQYLSAGLIVLQFFLPFLILLSSRVKRYSSLLLRVMLFILVMRVVDLFWIITPAFGRQTLQVHWLDVTLLATIGGFWLAWFARQVRAAPLLARHDTRLQEAWQYEYSAPSPA
jgi:amino acid permease